MNIRQRFFSIIKLNAVSAFMNLTTTVVIARWFGSAVYANYILDLSIISILMILLDGIPAAYSVFRAQDESTHMRSVAASTMAGVVILAFTVALLGAYWKIFNAFSGWMVFYTLTMANKRYLDIRLQAQGRLNEFLAIDVLASIVRLVAMGGFICFDVESTEIVWAALAISTFVAQGHWACRNGKEFEPFKHVMKVETWHMIFRNRFAYFPYYIGILLKRTRDNLMPLLADIFFTTKEAAGAFFLIYRGLVFACGQIRVIEGLLNHRQTLAIANSFSFVKQAFIALCGQCLCLAVTIILACASEIDDFPWAIIGYLSCIIWFYVFSTLKRSDAYSKYYASAVNAGMAAYIVTALSLVYVCQFINENAEFVFVTILLCAEAIALTAMIYVSGRLL